MEKFSAIILAAGEGKRMNSTSPKVLQDLSGKPLIYYPLSELLLLKEYIKQIVVVTGHKSPQVRKEIAKQFPKQKSKIDFVSQASLSGTAKAVAAASKKLKHNNILIVCGDTPLITSATLKKFIGFYIRKKLSCAVLSAVFKRENSLGRIAYDKKGKLKGIIEKIELKDKAGKLAANCQVNSGIYCFKRGKLVKNLPKVKKNKKKQEYFLTDIVEILYKQKESLAAYVLSNPQEIAGINTKQDLSIAQGHMKQRVLDHLIDKGATIIDPKTTFIQAGVKIGKNTIIYPFTFIENGVIIGNNCSLGPFARLRKGTEIGNNSQIGDFIEINRSKIGRNVRIKHFGYLGDAVIEDNVNIGAGTVTANFDGKTKSKTYIRKGAFIGSDSILVAPLEIGKKSMTGAGSVVTRDVKSGVTVVGVPAKKLKSKKTK